MYHKITTTNTSGGWHLLGSKLDHQHPTINTYLPELPRQPWVHWGGHRAPRVHVTPLEAPQPACLTRTSGSEACWEERVLLRPRLQQNKRSERDAQCWHIDRLSTCRNAISRLIVFHWQVIVSITALQTNSFLVPNLTAVLPFHHKPSQDFLPTSLGWGWQCYPEDGARHLWEEGWGATRGWCENTQHIVHLLESTATAALGHPVESWTRPGRCWSYHLNTHNNTTLSKLTLLVNFHSVHSIEILVRVF